MEEGSTLVGDADGGKQDPREGGQEHMKIVAASNLCCCQLKALKFCNIFLKKMCNESH